jgi:predicted ATPase
MLLGRDQELAVLDEACRAAAAGQGAVVVVTGEPGIGKTALLTAAAAESSLAGAGGDRSRGREHRCLRNAAGPALVPT